MRRLVIITDPNVKSVTTLGTLIQHTLRGMPRDIFESISYFGAPLGDEPDIKQETTITWADYTHVLCIDTLQAGGSIKPFIGSAEVALYVCEPSPYLNVDIFPRLGEVNKIVVPSRAIKQALQESSIDSPMEVIEKASIVQPGINFKEYHTPYISSNELLREDIISKVAPTFVPQDFVIFCDAKHAADTCHMFRHLSKNVDNVKLLIRSADWQRSMVESIINGNDIPEDKVIIRSPRSIGDNAALYLISNLIYRPSTYGFWSYTLHEAACMNIPIAAGNDYVVGEMVDNSGISLPTSEFVPYERTYINRVNSYDAAKAVAEAISNRHMLEANTVAALAKFAAADYRASARLLIKEAFGL